MTNRYAIRLTKAAEKELYGLQLKQLGKLSKRSFHFKLNPDLESRGCGGMTRI